MDRRTLGRLRALLRTDRRLVAAVGLLLAVVAVSVAAPWLSPHDPTAVDYALSLLPPSAEHPLGTDNFGRDVLTRLLFGGRASLTAAATAVAVIVVLGTVVGAVAGFAGGVVDLVVTRVIDVLLAFPRLVLAIAIAALLGAGLSGLIIAVSVVSWPGYARIVRGLVLAVKEEGYVVAARSAGIPRLRILRTHVLGAIAGPLLVLSLVEFGEIVLGVAALSFLGLGIQQPTPEWGAMLTEARSYIEEAPWIFLAPGVAIFLVVLAVNYAGDAVRDALDPRHPHLPAPRPWRGRSRRRAEVAVRTKRTAALAAGPSPVVARVRGLTVGVRGGATVLDAVDLDVRAGECVGLVGESGSGKSTLAAALLGLVRSPLEIRSGTVSVLGADTAGWTWDDWRPVRGRHVSLITQDPMNALNPLLRVREQLDECGTAHGLGAAAARDRSREMLALMRLPGAVEEQYPHQLSGGMRQRIVIAMALVDRPQLVIADEPTTALDVSTQARILDELAELRRELGVGMLFVSHDLRIVEDVADRVVVLHAGAVVEQNTTAELFRAPAHEHTRRLLAAIPEVARAVR